MTSRRSARPGRAPAPTGVLEAVAEALAEGVPGGVRPGELDRDGRALRWLEAGPGPGVKPGPGEGVPVVVLIAGMGTSALTWAPLLPELARPGRVVAYDRAGLGASEPDQAPVLTLDGQVADLTALLRHLDAGPAVLVGHSWGGQLAQLLARERPELVAGLVLVDPAHEDFRPRAISAVESLLLRAGLLRVGLLRVGLVRAGLLRAAPAPAAPVAGDALARAEAAVLAHPHQRRAVLAENRLTNRATGQLRRRRAAGPPLRVPVTVLSATTGLPRGLRARFTAVQAGITAGTDQGVHLLVPGAGHAVHADRPEVVAAAVREVSGRVRTARRP
ncbi:alpha/beta hydrolase [Kitasatospora sp. NPDC096128]|uniref:alpha/beta fold hydrolase n=1 Tax=Kitasatospora sp. NPDC096128 TaxID=3155547 RepID=UPI0033238270